MDQNNCQLHADVAHVAGGVEAQLVEIDIAARGKSVKDLLNEIRHAIIVSFEIAKELGETPFVGLLTSGESNCQREHFQKGSDQIGIIEIPEDVGAALAAALRLRKPIRQIPVVTAYSQAA